MVSNLGKEPTMSFHSASRLKVSWLGLKAEIGVCNGNGTLRCGQCHLVKMPKLAKKKIHRCSIIVNQCALRPPPAHVFSCYWFVDKELYVEQAKESIPAF